MITDLNKGISTIEYNYLNLPVDVTKNAANNITYVYDAAAIKLMKGATINSTCSNRYYAGIFEYDNDKSLDLIHNEESIVNLSGVNFIYEYFLKDHLGNTRVAFNVPSGSAAIVQQDDYYPFGMLHKPQSPNNDNKYLYNGKELQDENLGGVSLDWYDYGARFYDPQIGRWHVQDPLAEYRLSLSPYNYCKNNPILYIDLFGLIDTVRLPPVNVVAYRSQNNQNNYVMRWQLFGLALETEKGRASDNGYRARHNFDADYDIVSGLFDYLMLKFGKTGREPDDEIALENFYKTGEDSIRTLDYCLEMQIITDQTPTTRYEITFGKPNIKLEFNEVDTSFISTNNEIQVCSFKLVPGINHIFSRIYVYGDDTASFYAYKDVFVTGHK